MEMIIISAPSELIVFPPHPLTKDTQQTFTLKLGYMWSSQSYIQKLRNLTKEIEKKSCFVIIQIREDFFVSCLKQAVISCCDPCYKERRARKVDLHCIMFSKEEYDEMIHVLTSSSKSVQRLWSSDDNCYFELFDFKAVILQKKNNEDLEDIRNLGTGVLTLLGRK